MKRPPFPRRRLRAAVDHFRELRNENLAGDPAYVRCHTDPNDVLVVQRIGLPVSERRMKAPVIAVVTTMVSKEEGDVSAAVMLTLDDARRLAAYLLNAADEADHTPRLLFTAPSPDGKEPSR